MNLGTGKIFLHCDRRLGHWREVIFYLNGTFALWWAWTAFSISSTSNI